MSFKIMIGSMFENKLVLAFFGEELPLLVATLLCSIVGLLNGDLEIARRGHSSANSVMISGVS